jgi:hypothetical protein
METGWDTGHVHLSAGSSQSPQSSIVTKQERARQNSRHETRESLSKQSSPNKRESAPTSNPDVASFQPKSDSAVASDWCRAELPAPRCCAVSVSLASVSVPLASIVARKVVWRRIESAQNRIVTMGPHTPSYFGASTCPALLVAVRQAAKGPSTARCGSGVAKGGLLRLSLQGKTSRDSRCREKLPATLAAGRLTVSAAC